jgi:hypothetical protein
MFSSWSSTIVVYTKSRRNVIQMEKKLFTSKLIQKIKLHIRYSKGSTMRILYVLIVAIVFAGCSNFLSDTSSSKTFTLKFINTRSFRIDSLFLKPVTDTADWGVSVLPIAYLDSLKYVVLRGLAKAPMYAVKIQFDSAGTPVFLKDDYLPTGPDTITVYAGLGISDWETGYCRGWVSWTGERDMTPR